MDFTTIGNPGNVADTTGRPNPVGAVAYTYQIGKYEVSRDMITKANSLGNLGISLSDMEHHGGNGSDKPATGIHFHEAAKFVNWLNTSSGNQAAYNLDELVKKMRPEFEKVITDRKSTRLNSSHRL